MSILKSNYNIFYKLLILIIICVLIYTNFASVASAKNYYVATWGSNSNDGLSVSTPKHNFSNSEWFNSTNIKPGDTVYLINGTWIDEQMYLTSSDGNSQYVVGNSTSYVTITSYNGTPTLKNNSLSGSNYGIFSTNTGSGTTQRIRISNITVDGYYQDVYFRFASMIEITNMTIKNTPLNSNCISMIDINNSIFSNNDIGDCGYSSLGLTASARDTNDIIINNNIFHDNSNHSLINIKNSGGANTKTVYNVTIRNNIFRDHPTWNTIALYSSNTTPSVAIYNITYSDNEILNINGNVDLEVTALTNSKWENNTIKDSAAGFNTQSSDPKKAVGDNVIFKNNIAIDNVINPATMSINPNSTLYWIRNQFYGPTRWDYKVAGGRFVIIDALPTNNRHLIGTDNNGLIVFYNTSNVVLSETGANTTYYHPDRSEYVTKGNETVTITTYPMTARPSSGYATITVNKFNTSLPSGQILINITVNTTNGNNVVFNISDLSPGRSYTIKKSGSRFVTRQANPEGIISFNNSNWSVRTFTVEEDPQPVGNIIGKISHINLTSLPGATVSLYYQDGAPYGLTALSGANGKFQFNNITVGSYYVNASRDGYIHNRSSVFNVLSNSTVNIGNISLRSYDINGDGGKNVLDLYSVILQQLDLNHDGRVNASDVFIVGNMIDVVI